MEILSLEREEEEQKERRWWKCLEMTGNKIVDLTEHVEGATLRR